MATTPDNDRNFINGLSAFWPAFFRDTTALRTYFDGSQVALGQVYLDMMQLVLGTSLQHMPLFSKRYFQSLLIREDQLAFVEGASTAGDRYVYNAEDPVAGLPSIMNRVVAPTAILQAARDYDLTDGSIAFRHSLFDWQSGEPLSLFPIRTVQVTFPSEFRSVDDEDWSIYGVKTGDTFWVRIANGTALEAKITGISGSTLLLDRTFTELKPALVSRVVEYTVLRTPWDNSKVGVLVPFQATSATTIAVTPNAGSTKVLSAAADTSWIGKYIYLYDAAKSHNSVYARVTAVSGGVSATLDLTYNFIVSAGPFVAYLLDHRNSGSPATPTFAFDNTYLDASSVTVSGRRLVDRHVVNQQNIDTVFPAGEAVQEGVDYLIDSINGTITYLSVWDPLYPARVNYTWRLNLAPKEQTARGTWAAFTAYAKGDVVTVSTRTYAATAAIASAATFVLADGWIEYQEPVKEGQVHSVQEMALWGVDALLDHEGLYNNFGYLLGYRKATSEQYRTFLRGVAQLFLLGPTLERFESALNVMAGYPVVRDDGEVLVSFDTGIHASGVDGALIDTGEGRDGVLTIAGSTFTSITATFFPTDVGAVLRIRNGVVYDSYVISGFTSAHEVVVSPAVPANQTALQWNFQHSGVSKRFTTSSSLYAFSADDIDAVLMPVSTHNAANNGVFRIIAVESTNSVILESPYSFIDETAIAWTLSRTKQQVVRTSRADYVLPLNTPVDEAFLDVTTWNVRTFEAFDTLTTAFTVEDYVRNPTWWRDVMIPQELLQLVRNETGRRRVSTQLVEHVFGALDGAVFGDFGLSVGTDSDQRPGIQRRGSATWFGGNIVCLAYDAGIPVGRSRDVGQYLVVRTALFESSYRIAAVSEDGQYLTLENFPPRAVRHLAPPFALDVELPPLIYRRTVAFVMMDKFLKYHAVRIRIDRNAPLSSEFIAEVTSLIQDAKPLHTFVYLEPVTTFEDVLTITDEDDGSAHRFGIAYGPYCRDRFAPQENRLQFGTRVQFNDAFSYDDQTASVVTTPGSSSTITPSTLMTGTIRTFFVMGRFDLAVTTHSGTKTPAEGTDYTFDYETGLLSILPGASFDTSPATFRYVVCFLRQRLPADPLSLGETPVVVCGTDPTIHLSDLTMLPGDIGLIDRAIEITLS